jgi:signal transduction histidine kinase
MHFNPVPSLRAKIVSAYAAIAFLTLVLSVFAYEELRLLEGKILLGERIAEVFDTTMEIRRFERNLFLHGQEADYRDNASYRARLRELLERDEADFIALAARDQLAALKSSLSNYGPLIDSYVGAAQDPARRQLLESSIRAAGQDLVAASEAVVAAERAAVRASLSSFRAILFFSVVGVALLTVAVGQALSRRVVRPLKQIESGVEAIAAGRSVALAAAGDDREIASISRAFDHMLRELDLRQRHLLRTEKLASMGTMVSGVAHELNNPLSNIWSSCQIMLEDRRLPADAPQRELLRQIDEQSIRARNIVRSLLDFTRDRQFRAEPVPLDELVRQTLRFLKGDVPPGMTVNVEVPSSLTLAADRQRLQQALLNLLKNAIDAAGADGHVAVTAVRHAPAADGTDGEDGALAACRALDAVDIIVDDDGPGIAPAILPRIFDPFFTTKDVGRGMGLGLFIVYRVVEEHGGCIAAANRQPRGARFVMRLPAGLVAAS